MTTEEWRTVAAAPDYEVSNLGRVRTLADLAEQHPADLISVGEHVTIIASPISAARWQELTPRGLLDVDGVQVPVTVVPLVSLDVAS